MPRSIRIPVATALLASMVLVTVTPGCTDQPYSSPQQQAQNACQAFGPKTLSGALIGGLAGAGLGAAAGGISSGKGAAIGALAGGILGLGFGAFAGHSYDQRDCVVAQQALAQVRYAQVGQTIPWTSPATGSSGSYTALGPETQASEPGKFCRQIRQDSMLTGHQATSQQLYTCRDASGDYHTVQMQPGVPVA